MQRSVRTETQEPRTVRRARRDEDIEKAYSVKTQTVSGTTAGE